MCLWPSHTSPINTSVHNTHKGERGNFEKTKGKTRKPKPKSISIQPAALPIPSKPAAATQQLLPLQPDAIALFSLRPGSHYHLHNGFDGRGRQ